MKLFKDEKCRRIVQEEVGSANACTVSEVQMHARFREHLSHSTHQVEFTSEQFHGFGITRRAGREVSDGEVIPSVLQGEQASGEGIPGRIAQACPLSESGSGPWAFLSTAERKYYHVCDTVSSTTSADEQTAYDAKYDASTGIPKLRAEIQMISQFFYKHVPRSTQAGRERLTTCTWRMCLLAIFRRRHSSTSCCLSSLLSM